MNKDQLNKAMDKYLVLRTKRLALEKQADEIKSEESLLKQLVLKEMLGRMEQGTTYTTPGKAQADLKMVAEAELSDWDALQKHIQATGEFDLLQKRVTVTAVRARWEVGKEVPGITQKQVPEVTIKRAKV